MFQDQLTDSSFHFDELLRGFPEPTARLSSYSSSSSFSSVPWWDVLDNGTEEDHHNNNNNSEDVTDAYNYLDFMKGGSEMWGDHDDNLLNHLNTSDSDFQQPMITVDEQPLQSSTVQPQKKDSSKDLAMVFREWLKSNKGSFSAEDLRKVRLRKSTIESAIQRFGGGKKGMKRLLVLILEWVQKSRDHDQGKRMRTPKDPRQSRINSNPRPYPNITDQNGTIYIDHSPPDHNPCLSLSNRNIPHLTLPQSPQLSTYAGKGISTTVEAGTKTSSMVDQYTNESIIDFTNPYKHTSDYSCSPSHYAMPSPTKEARRARMARQKHLILDHKHNQSHHGYHQQIDRQNSIENQHAMLIGTNSDNCMESPASTGEDEPANWIDWP